MKLTWVPLNSCSLNPHTTVFQKLTCAAITDHHDEGPDLGGGREEPANAEARGEDDDDVPPPDDDSDDDDEEEGGAGTVIVSKLPQSM